MLQELPMNKPSSSWIEKILKKPHIIFSFLALFVFAGMLGYSKIHRNLFPNSNYPEIALVIIEPGASAKSIASNIALVAEEELYTLDEIRRVYSNTIDEVTVIRAEFEYSKNIDTAANDVTNALSKIRAKLPSDIQEPQIIKITEATAPILVVAMSPKNDTIDLEDIRDLANSEIKHALLKTKGIANVDIFGGYQKELQIIIDKKKLDSLRLSLGDVLAAVQKSDKEYAIGFISNDKHRYLVKSQGKREQVQKLKHLSLSSDVKLADIAEIYFGHYENTAAYFGNGKKAIAISVQRSLNADVISTIEEAEKIIEKCKSKFTSVNFEISDTQKDTIEQSIQNMLESLRDAIIMSTIVVFLFLASFRQILVILVTIPLVYTSTIALMWLTGINFNVITLTAIILALGLLLDDTVVVVENIERHYKELGKPIRNAVLDGTKEIMFADLSGSITTMVALAPMLFVGGYPQTVFAPLVGTLLLALLASYIISIIAVPLLSLYILTIQNPILLKIENGFHSLINRVTTMLHTLFASVVKTAITKKNIGIAFFAALIVLFIISVKVVMPVVGQELMPPMDTGGVNIKITTDTNLPIEKSEEIMREINSVIQKHGKVLRISGSIGSEPGVLSIGSGSGTDYLSIVATYVDRYQRDKTIWEISDALRKEIAQIANVKDLDIAPYGATGLASIRASINAMLSGSDFETLYEAGTEVESALKQTKGIVAASKTWDMDKTVYNLIIDEVQAMKYGLTYTDITTQVQTVLRGVSVASFPKSNHTDYNVRVWFPKEQINTIETVLSLYIDSPKGKIPLNTIASLSGIKEPTVITREGLNYTIEVYGHREKNAISHMMQDFEKQLDAIKLPQDVQLEQIGDIMHFESSAQRMIKAIAVAIILIFFTLIMMFSNIKISLMILFSIPLTIIGASWTLLAMDYHVSMPSMMGFILLSGIIVNNAILLIHFALEQMKTGMHKTEAMLESIKIRTRPVLMTAFSVSVGMFPIAQGAAIGLERLAPLGAVAIGGLIIGTLMTLVFIPILFIWAVKDNKHTT